VFITTDTIKTIKQRLADSSDVNY